MFLSLLITLTVLIMIVRKKPGFLRTKPFIVLEILSVLWWVALIVDQLRTDLVCTPDDGLCNSGNTVWGDITWGSMLAFFSLAIVWSFALGIGFLLRTMRSKK